jgi:hypothetical protein
MVEKGFGFWIFNLMEYFAWLTLSLRKNSILPAFLMISKKLPPYTGLNSVEDILHSSRARQLLWLEILFNDQLNLKPWQDNPEFQDAYGKACRWFTTYRLLIQFVFSRVSLPPDSR